VCKPGRFLNAAATFCDLCPIGKFQNSSNSTSCYDCPGNQATNTAGAQSAIECGNCSPGNGIQENSCSPCGIGLYNDGSSSSCSSCKPGTFSNSSGASFCGSCQKGKYSDVFNACYCNLCPKGKWSEALLQNSREQCINCPSGKFGPSEGLSSISMCENCPAGSYNPIEGAASSNFCVKCPISPGIICDSGTFNPTIKPGYWSDGELVYSCIPQAACVGGSFLSLQVNQTASSTPCSTGYSGSLCSDCDQGFFRLIGLCRKCLSQGIRYTVLFMIVLLILVVVWRTLVSPIQLPQSVKISLFWFQFLSLYPLIFDAWPAELKVVFDIGGFFNFDIGYIGIGCDVSRNFYGVTLFKLFAPILLFVILFAFQSIMERKFLPKSKRMTLLAHILFITNVLSLQMFSTMFQVFNCTHQPDGTANLLADPSEKCYSQVWIAVAAIDSVLIVFYLTVLPLYLLNEVRHRGADKDKIIDLLFGQITSSYDSEAKGFEVVRIVFKFFFVLIRDVLGVSKLSKSTLLCLLIAAQTCIESRYRPYKQKYANDLSML
jgi:hypothetical protein